MAAKDDDKKILGIIQEKFDPEKPYDLSRDKIVELSALPEDQTDRSLVRLEKAGKIRNATPRRKVRGAAYAPAVVDVPA